MPPISDLRSDSPLNFTCVGCSYLGSSECLIRARMFTAVAVVKFCCYSEVFGFHDAGSVHHASSHTRSCFQAHRSPWFLASSDLRRTGVTAVIKLSLEPTQRHSLSARSFILAQGEPGVDPNAVAQLFARVPSSPRRMVRENNGARICVLSGSKSVDQGFSYARVSRSITHRSLACPTLSESDRAGHRRPESRTPPQHVTRTGTTSVAQLLRKSAATLSALFVRNPKQTTDRKEFIMHQSRGAVSFTPLFTTDDIGLRKDANVEHVVKVFLNVGEAIAARWIEMPRGILLLQAVPDQPASGAIYLYDRERHIFFFVDFVEGRDDPLTAAEVDQLVAEYDLVSRTANRAFLPAGTGSSGMA
jgi:hypothetical protein